MDINTQETNTQTNIINPKKKTNNKLILISVVMLAIILVLTAAVIILVSKIHKLKYDIKHEFLLEDFVPAVNTRIYSFFNDGDSIFLEDSYFGQIRIPAYPNVPKASYDYDKLVFENNRYTYHDENGVVTSKTGIDISHHQMNIDWEKVAADGIDFALIRVGYRGYEEGKLNVDAQFKNHISGAIAAGIDVGVYFYSQAVTVTEAKEEAQLVLDSIDAYEITYPVIYDWELPDADNARTNGMNGETLTECAAAFCDTIADAGYLPMIYAGKRLSLLVMDMSKLYSYDFWYPQYKDGHNPPEYPYDFQIWQYASDGKVDGIDGDVDLNICFVDYTTTMRGRY